MRIEPEQIEAVFRQLEEWGMILPEDWPESWLQDLIAEFDTGERSGRLLSDAREWLEERVEDGATCPCCNQYAKIYRRKLNSGIARALITMHRAGGTDWVHKPTVLSGLGAAARDESIARYWGLVEEETKRRDDGGRAGWWRVTERGHLFLTGQLKVPKYARVYDSRCLGLVGDPIGVRDALGSKFNYEDLMRGSDANESRLP